MELTGQKPRITALLTNQLLGRVEQMRLNPNRRLSNRGRGEHLSRKGGTSTEFADYRDYSEGDDVRFIDWNAYSRLRRPYLKLYRHEEEMHIAILIDASSSMVFEGKLELAKQIAAAFGVMGLFGGERVSVYAFHQSDKGPVFLKPASGRAKMRQMFSFIEGINGGGSQPLETGVKEMLKHHRGRGAAVILSDFLTFGDIRRACNLIYSAGLEIFGLQILAPVEIDPFINGDLRLVDSETETTLDISSAGDLLSIYQEYRLAYQERLHSYCAQRGGRFLTVNSTDTVPSILLDTLVRKGWVK